MKAMVVPQHGRPDVLTCVDRRVPVLRPNEVLVHHKYIGVNFVDTQHRAGLYYPVKLPLIPSTEASGVIAALGDDVADFEIGDRVAYAGIMPGVYAEYAAVPENRLIRVPENLPLDQTAASLLQGMTAHLLVTQIYPLKAGEVALIYAAASGVGSLLLQLSKRLGAVTIGVTSSLEKAEVVRKLGADNVLLYDHPQFAAKVSDLIDGQGVHVVYDGVGSPLVNLSLNVLRSRGHLIEFGQSGGQPIPLDITWLSGITGTGNRGSLSITWASAGDYLSSPDDLRSCAAFVFDLVQSQRLQVHVSNVYPLEAAAQAHKDLESRTVSGKLLLAVA